MTASRIRSFAFRIGMGIPPNGVRSHVAMAPLRRSGHDPVRSLWAMPTSGSACLAAQQATRHALTITAPSSWAAAVARSWRKPTCIIRVGFVHRRTVKPGLPRGTARRPAHRPTTRHALLLALDYPPAGGGIARLLQSWIADTDETRMAGRHYHPRTCGRDGNENKSAEVHV